MSTKYTDIMDVPNVVICTRLDELAEAITKGTTNFESEFTMRIPAELDRDADIVMSAASDRLKAFNDFYDNVSCLFAEGVEFMNKIQLYDAFKAEFFKIIGEITEGRERTTTMPPTDAQALIENIRCFYDGVNGCMNARFKTEKS